MVKNFCKQVACFGRCESGQDLTEYALLLAFICIAAAAIFNVNSASITSIWGTANSTLSRAYSAAS